MVHEKKKKEIGSTELTRAFAHLLTELQSKHLYDWQLTIVDYCYNFFILELWRLWRSHLILF